MKSIFLVFIVSLMMTVSLCAQDIFSAVKSADPAKVRLILEKNPSLVNLKDNSGNTPVHYAAITGSVEMIKLLIENGADINSVNKNGKTPVKEAVINGKKDASLFLVKCCPGINV